MSVQQKFPSSVKFRSGPKVRPIIRFYVEMVTLVIALPEHISEAVNSLFWEPARVWLPSMTSTPYGLTGHDVRLSAVWKYSAAFCSCLFQHRDRNVSAAHELVAHAWQTINMAECERGLRSVPGTWRPHSTGPEQVNATANVVDVVKLMLFGSI